MGAFLLLATGWGLLSAACFTFGSRSVQVKVQGRVVSERGAPIPGEEIAMVLDSHYGYFQWRNDEPDETDLTVFATTDAKIASVLPPESIALVEDTESVLESRPGPFKDYRRQRKLISVVTEAALQRKSLDVTYHTFSREALTERRLDPGRALRHRV